MPEKFLYETLDSVSDLGFLERDIPGTITQNLNPKLVLRPYQVEAFARFLYCYKKDYPGKAAPIHLLFNMATGSGRTLIMAGLILYLYGEGYRNFLFFVNSTNIIEKTKSNFLDPASAKYLFNREILFGGRRVAVASAENFEGVNPHGINICFTTIQKLHSDLTTMRENAITYEDFRRHKVVLIADEAHHINVQTRAEREMFESWESTVERIHIQARENILLEFTATHDYETPSMVAKYQNKVIIRYDLLQFRNDRFSKDVVIVQSDFSQSDRMLQALILSQYKKEVAAKYRINLKPILLFKAQRTIAQSRATEAAFHELIAALDSKQIARIRKSDIPIVKHALRYFRENGISDAQLAERLKRDFQPAFCLSVNDEAEKEQHQILLNTLEDQDNRLRVIFAVKKLNEGWDVLNLFDIVRCYEARDPARTGPGPTTLSEAQLIGRGARYFPFTVGVSTDRYRRKFDGDLGHELRVLEELHYHSINDVRYLSEIRSALRAQGLLDQYEVTREYKLKDTFKKSKFYKYGVLWLNDRRPRDYARVKAIADLGVKRRNYVHTIAAGRGRETVALENGDAGASAGEQAATDVRVKDIEANILQAAISRRAFFTLSNLRTYLPRLDSMAAFATSEDYLGGLEITFRGGVSGLADNRREKLAALVGLLEQVESEVRASITEYEGTRDFRAAPIREVFKDRLLRFSPNNPVGSEDPEFAEFAGTKEWSTFSAIYGTSEEKAFVRMLDRQMGRLRAKYEQIYVLRNQGDFAIYSFADGRAFEPDFALFLRERDGKLLVYQLFIEPKGRHLKEHDKWKEQFLEAVTSEFQSRLLTIQGQGFRLIGLPFYNNDDENEFRRCFEAALQTES